MSHMYIARYHNERLETQMLYFFVATVNLLSEFATLFATKTYIYLPSYIDELADTHDFCVPRCCCEFLDASSNVHSYNCRERVTTVLIRLWMNKLVCAVHM